MSVFIEGFGTPPACPRPAPLPTGGDKPRRGIQREKAPPPPLAHVPNITFCPRVNYMAAMKSSAPAFSHCFHY